MSLWTPSGEHPVDRPGQRRSGTGPARAPGATGPEPGTGAPAGPEDLSPEGFYQTLALLDKPLRSLDQLKLHMLQWTFHEVSDSPDGWMIGGQVNLVSRSGTNSWHGSLFENHQDNAFNARFQRVANKPRLTFNQFGRQCGTIHLQKGFLGSWRQCM